MKEVKRSVFSGAFSLAGKVSTPGKKVSESARPELVALSTKDKFTLNSKARKLMGIDAALDSGQDVRVGIVDAYGQVTNQEDRYYLVLGYTKNNQEIGAKLNKGGEFSYSGMWGNMLMNDIDIDEVSIRDLVKEGIVVENETPSGKTSYISTKKLYMEVVPMSDEDGKPIEEMAVDFDKDGNEIVTKIWALKDFEFVDHSPQTGDEDEDWR